MEKTFFFGIWYYKWATAGELQGRKANEQMEKPTNQQSSQKGKESSSLNQVIPLLEKKRLQLNYPTTNPLYLLLKVSVYEMPPLVHFCDRLLGHLQYPHGGVWGRLAAWYLCLISQACSWSANAGRANDQLSRKWVHTAKLTSTAVTEMATKQNHSKFNHLLWISPRYAQNAKQGNRMTHGEWWHQHQLKKKNDCL